MSYLSDILEQPAVIRTVLQTYGEQDIWSPLQTVWGHGQDQSVILTGMGGSYQALYPTWLALNQQGISALHIDTSELIHYLPTLIERGGILVVASQSGESVEIRKLMELVQAQKPQQMSPLIVSVTNGRENTLADHSDFAFYTEAGSEVGVATKTFTSTLALLDLMVRAVTSPPPLQAKQAWEDMANAMEQLLTDWQTWLEPGWQQVQGVSSFALIARGPSLASALNGALVLKEAARLPAGGFSGGQFRHGPMEMLSPNLGVLLFTTPGPTLALHRRLAQDLAQRSDHCICIGQAVNGEGIVNLPLPDCDPILSPVLEIVAVQLLTAKLAERAGIIPGQFRWSGKVIEQE